MGFNELSLMDGDCDDAPCGELPTCTIACLTEDGDSIAAPPTLSIQPTWSTCTLPDFEPSTNDCGTWEYTPSALDEDGCVITGTPIEYDLGSYSEAHDNAIFTLLNSVPLGMELVDIEPGANCCTFHYETPVMSSPPSLYGNAALEIGTTHQPTEFLGDRIQHIGDHPGTLVNTPAVLGIVGDCDIGELVPVMPGGQGPVYAHATLDIEVCRSSCDGSWYGSAQLNFRYDHYAIYPTPGFATYSLNYEGIISEAPEIPIVYWHVPNTGTKTNASGIFWNGVDFETADVSFTLTFEGDDPCPPDPVTKVPTKNSEYSGGYGNLSPSVLIQVIPSTLPGEPLGTAGIRGFGDAITGNEDDGWNLQVYFPDFDSGVTTAEEILDVIDADPRFAITDRVGDDTFTLIDPGFAIPIILATAPAGTSGGFSGTPVAASAVFAAAIIAMAGPNDASSKVAGGSLIYYVPGFIGAGTSSCGLVFQSITDTVVAAEGCPLAGLCFESDAEFTTFDVTGYSYCSDDCTWAFA